TTPKSGTYTLLLEGSVYNSSDVAYSFAVNKVTDARRDISLDEVVDGAIDVAGQRQFLEFTLAEDTQVFLDALVSADFEIRLDGPRGVEFENRSLRYADRGASDPVLNLVAGTYTLT